jgi:hypothetical protein
VCTEYYLILENLRLWSIKKDLKTVWSIKKHLLGPGVFFNTPGYSLEKMKGIHLSVFFQSGLKKHSGQKGPSVFFSPLPPEKA